MIDYFFIACGAIVVAAITVIFVALAYRATIETWEK